MISSINAIHQSSFSQENHLETSSESAFHTFPLPKDLIGYRIDTSRLDWITHYFKHELKSISSTRQRILISTPTSHHPPLQSLSVTTSWDLIHLVFYVLSLFKVFICSFCMEFLTSTWSYMADMKIVLWSEDEV